MLYALVLYSLVDAFDCGRYLVLHNPVSANNVGIMGIENLRTHLSLVELDTLEFESYEYCN